MRPFTLLLAIGVMAITGTSGQESESGDVTHTWTYTIPHIDRCGSSLSGHVSCPGVGVERYYYRCCSSDGHCGPKNPLQADDLYCGQGCQKGYGSCDLGRVPPASPSMQPTISTDGTCGPIVNKKCPRPLCCSGSNYCGSGPDFCEAANWCQDRYGNCKSPE